VAVVGEAVREFLAPEIEVLRVTVVEQVPDHLDPVLARRAHERLDGGEIVAAAAEIDEGPADSLARGVDAEGRKVAVILIDRLVVPGGGDLVEPLAMAVEARGALESGQEKAAKHALRSSPRVHST
jgi:hypothetical protein